ncbi:MAG: GDP-mannose 4,6-dehydratase [Alphaproteobacteria bacterium]|nr:GDP-mannose 4,6-dehydratase [Alphaproteobacteria bacterium]
MSILLTGAAGFIGYHVSEALLRGGHRVIGIDNLNDYYDVRLKEARLARLRAKPGFVFHRVDIADRDRLFAALQNEKGIRRIVHLAAQAGVRHSLKDPFAYVHSNLQGHMVLLEFARALEKCEHMVYASSSSVYGGNTKLPFSVEDRVDQPVSLYAATKKANELMSYSYSHLFRLPLTGLRFFTVYGPWGRPDMALYIFARAIVEGRPIEVNNYGDMERDFTYIDDIVSGVLAALDNPPPDREGEAPHRVYNIGNHQPEPLLRLIEILENALGRKAEKIMRPMQPGEVRATYADIDAIARDFGYAPTTPIDKGVPRFVDWFRSYHGV